MTFGAILQILHFSEFLAMVIEHEFALESNFGTSLFYYTNFDKFLIYYHFFLLNILSVALSKC